MIVGVVISNLLYLIVAIAVAVIGALVVVLRHRKPKSVEANVASFHRGLRALAPDQPSGPSGSGPSWGGASRRAATTPSAFTRTATSGRDAATEAPAPSGDDPEVASDPPETDVETEGEAGPDQVESQTEEAATGPSDEDAGSAADEHLAEDSDNTDDTAASAASEPDPTEAAPGAAPADDPVHLTSRKRRPSSASASQARDESEVPTEEAGTG